MLNRLSIRRKLLVLLAPALAGLVLFVSMNIYRTWQDVTAIEQATVELEAQTVTQRVIVELQRERDMTASHLAQVDGQIPTALGNQRSATDAALADWKAWVEPRKAGFRREMLGSTEEFDRSATSLNDLRAQVERRALSSDESIAKYSAITQQALILFSHCGELTPNPEQYALTMQFAIVMRLIESDGLLRGTIAAGLASGQVTAEQRLAVLGLTTQATNGLRVFDQYATGELKERWKSVLQSPKVLAAESYLKAFQERRLGEGFAEITAPVWFSAQTGKIEAYLEFSNLLSARLKEISSSELASARIGLGFVVAVAIAVFLISLFSALAVSRRIVKPLNEAVTGLEAVAKGDFSRNVEVTSQDEIGKLGLSINDTAAQLSVSQVTMARSQNLVENAPINIMMADRDLKLIYINPASLKTFRKLEHLLPCKADEMLGKSIDIFHKDPAHQRRILADPKNLPYHAQILLGTEYLDLDAAAILDKDGSYLGPMVSWTLVTDQKRIAESNARSQNLVDNAPINIMMADRDLKLIYINPASLKTFRQLEHLLPCKADEMLGRSIDIFHKNPAHQRKILSDPNNLPYHAQIQLGPEFLDLDAAAIIGKDGSYLGPMVSWTVVTDQKKAKDRDLQVQAQVTGIASELNQNSTNLVSMSNTMAANAEENSSQANNVSVAAEEVSANVSSVAAAVEEMSATIQEVSKTVIRSSEVTQKAVAMSKKASGLVTQLGESSNEISQVTKVIASIAQQTNILALNATIEAARAGEAGKGFAVVANEVKELAKSTSKMTEDISTRIAGIQQSTSEAVVSIEEINRIMSEVDSLSSTVASAVEEQSATTNEISRSMTEASTGVNEIVRNITGMAEAAKDTSKQALASKDGAESLGQLAQRLQEIVELFAAANAKGNGGNGHAVEGSGMTNGGAAAKIGHAPQPTAPTLYS